MTVVTEWTDEELMALPHLGKVELINGKIIMAPAGAEHGDIGIFLGGLLAIHVRKLRLGRVFDSSTGFRMRSGNAVSPDVAFVTAQRLRGQRKNYKRFLPLSPDLAVEILSPNDLASDVHGKMTEYFANGTTLVWIIDPALQTLQVFTNSNTPERTLTLADTLTADPLIPGFRLPLAELFESPDFD